MRPTLALRIALQLALLVAAQAADFYVAGNGSDANPGHAGQAIRLAGTRAGHSAGAEEFRCGIRGRCDGVAAAGNLSASANLRIDRHGFRHAEGAGRVSCRHGWRSAFGCRARNSKSASMARAGVCSSPQGRDAGRIQFSIDDAAYRSVETFTRWSTGLHLPWAVILDDELKDGHHMAKVRIAAKHNAKSTGTALRVIHLLLN